MVRFRLSAGLVELELRSALDPAVDGERLTFRDRPSAVALVERLAAGVGSASLLRRVLASASLGSGARITEDAEVRQLLAQQIASGALRVWRLSTPPLWARDGEDTEGDDPPPPEPGREDVWIAIELVEEDGRPVAGDPYVLEAGSMRREGKLDGDGYAEVKGIPEGTYAVSFPARDRTDFRRSEKSFGTPRWLPMEAEEAPPQRFEAASWLEIELVEEDGRPVTGEPYAVELHDRTVRTGVLDDLGRAVIFDVPQGSYRVWFPERHAPDVRRA